MQHGFFFFLSALLTITLYAAPYPAYVSPKDGAQYVSRESNIIFRTGDAIDAASLTSARFLVTGRSSGAIAGRLELSDDGKTALFMPARKYTAGEAVTVNYSGGIRTAGGAELAPFTLQFTVTVLENPMLLSEQERARYRGEYTPNTTARPVTGAANTAADSLPQDFPVIRVDSINNPAPGFLFMSVSTDAPGIGYYNYILDNRGNVVKYMKEDHHYPNGFKVQPNGQWTYGHLFNSYQYAGGGQTQYRVMDTAFTVIDSFQCGNGYYADSHDFYLMPNGHAIIVAYDLQPVDMSRLITGGHPGAMVYGSIIQELDLNKRVVFQWRSWDAIPITDSYNNILANGFDYIHVNGVRVDFDGNILFCSRLLCEVTKLNRSTGEIMWRLGGKHNEFTFINEHAENAPTYFTHPHSLDILPNGNITLFDNGLLHSPQYSRGVEYKLDQVNKTATLVWEYRHTPDIYAATQGSVQRLPNGYTLIGWGNASLTGKRAVTELTPDNRISFEMTLPVGVLSYRVGKYPFRIYTPAATVTMQDLQPGIQYDLTQNGSPIGMGLYFSNFSSGYNFLTVKKHATAPVNCTFPDYSPRLLPERVVVQGLGFSSFSAEISFAFNYPGTLTLPTEVVVYRRDFENSGQFEALPTSYNALTGRITAATGRFGEFVLGIPQQISVPGIPIAFSPAQGAAVDQSEPVPIAACSKGVTTSFHFQLSRDSLLSTLLVNDSAYASGLYTLTAPAPGATYYWRYRGKNKLGWSGWTPVQKFVTVAPFITIAAPAAGARLVKQKLYYITWADNTPRDVKIELYRGGVYCARIADTAYSSGGFQWKVPDTLVVDSTYQIKLTAYNSSGTSALSNIFSVVAASGITGEEGAVNSFALGQNYPNPFNPETVLRFTVPEGRHNITLAVYNSLGGEVAVLAAGAYSGGTYSIPFSGVGLASGVYYARLLANGATLTKKLLLLR